MSALKLLQQAANKRVLFCGENIVDIYHYCKPLGRPTKDAIVSVEIERTEKFAGGVAAARKHVDGLCKQIDVYAGGAVWKKERYVDSAHFHKLFQTYKLAGTEFPLRPKYDEYDAVIVLDYGHGMATSEFLRDIQQAKYLAVNVQTNSGNYGFNLATKYGKADYLCVDEPEARLATQNRDGPISDSLHALSRISGKVVITLGKKGAIGIDVDGKLYEQKAFTENVVDTMGAGDAFFSITALVAEEATTPEILKLGCAAGAIKSGIVGHQQSVTKDALTRFLAGIPESGSGFIKCGPGEPGFLPEQAGQSVEDILDRQRRLTGGRGPHSY